MKRVLLNTGAAVNTIDMSVLPDKDEISPVAREYFAADGSLILTEETVHL